MVTECCIIDAKFHTSLKHFKIYSKAPTFQYLIKPAAVPVHSIAVDLVSYTALSSVSCC